MNKRLIKLAAIRTVRQALDILGGICAGVLFLAFANIIPMFVAIVVTLIVGQE